MNNLKKIETLICESCGESFECGANVGNCWCFSIAIPQENLSQLKEQFKSCLCQDCLPKSSLSKSPTTQGNKINEKTEKPRT